MEQHQLQVWVFILFALFLANKAVAAADNAQNPYSRDGSVVSTVPIPAPPSDDDMQEMLDYLNRTMPKDGNDNSKYKGSPPKSQPVFEQSVVSNDSLHKTSNVYSGNEAPRRGSYIRAGSAIASAILLGHFFL